MGVPVQFVRVRDQDGDVAIGRDDLVRFSGAGQVVASALCLRLFARAFAELSPAEAPHRDAIRVLCGFPGDGVLDGIEMITRARSRGRLVVDTEAGAPESLPAPIGRFHFVIAVDGRARSYGLQPGFFTAPFVAMVRRHQDRPGTAAEQAAYQEAKHALIGRLLGAPDGALFRSAEAAVPPCVAEDTVTVLDHGVPLTIGFADCVKLHGRTSIGGAALGFRLMQRALADLAPTAPPERDTIALRTSFPGPGLRDAVEMIARAASRHAYDVDPACAPDTAPEGPFGRLWFEVSIGNASARYVAAPGAMDSAFIDMARLSRERRLTEAEAVEWQAMKERLAASILALSPQAALLAA